MSTHCYPILRHSKLDLPYPSHREMPFDILADLGTGRLDPPADLFYTKQRAEIFLSQLASVQRIVTSPSRRTISTYEILSSLLSEKGYSKPVHEIHPDFNEVYFDLRTIAGTGNIIPYSSLSRSVFSAELSGRGAESIEQIGERANRCIQYLKNQQENILVISHNFFMQVLELIARHRSPRDIRLSDLEQTKKNLYLDGYYIDSQGTFRAEW